MIFNILFHNIGMNLLWNADNADFQTQIKTDFYERKSVLIRVALLRLIRVPFGNYSIWD